MTDILVPGSFLMQRSTQSYPDTLCLSSSQSTCRLDTTVWDRQMSHPSPCPREGRFYAYTSLYSLISGDIAIAHRPPSTLYSPSVCTSYLVPRSTNHICLNLTPYMVSSHTTQALCTSSFYAARILCLYAITRPVNPFPSARNSIKHAHMAASICWAARARFTATNRSTWKTRVAQQQDPLGLFVCSRLQCAIHRYTRCMFTAVSVLCTIYLSVRRKFAVFC
jgi:hypothetical protein